MWPLLLLLLFLNELLMSFSEVGQFYLSINFPKYLLRGPQDPVIYWMQLRVGGEVTWGKMGITTWGKRWRGGEAVAISEWFFKTSFSRSPRIHLTLWRHTYVTAYILFKRNRRFIKHLRCAQIFSIIHSFKNGHRVSPSWFSDPLMRYD